MPSPDPQPMELRMTRISPLRRASQVALHDAAGAPARDAPGPGTRFRHAPDRQSLPGLRDGRRSADFTRRRARHLHSALCRQAEGCVDHGALDHERRRLGEPLPRPRWRPQMVPRRNADRLHRRWDDGRAGRTAGLRALDERRRGKLAGHARRASARRHRLVTRWHVDRLQHVGSQAERLEDRHAGRPRRRTMDAGPALPQLRALPRGSSRLPRAGVRAPLRRAGRRRDGAPAHQR